MGNGTGVATNYGEGGGLQNGRGGGGSFTPTIRVAEKFKRCLRRGTKRFEVVLTRELEDVAILMWGWGHEKFYPVLRRGRQKQFWICDFPILEPRRHPPPCHN